MLQKPERTKEIIQEPNSGLEYLYICDRYPNGALKEYLTALFRFEFCPKTGSLCTFKVSEEDAERSIEK